MTKNEEFQQFVSGAVEGLLWSSVVHVDMDEFQEVDSLPITPGWLDKIRWVVADNARGFFVENYEDIHIFLRELEASGYRHGADMWRAGFDFHLTTAGHGTGFWDYGLEIGNKLDGACDGHSDMGSDLYWDPETDSVAIEFNDGWVPETTALELEEN